VCDGEGLLPPGPLSRFSGTHLGGFRVHEAGMISDNCGSPSKAVV